MHTIDEVYGILDTATFNRATDSDMKRSNANVDGDTAMGAMLTYGSETARMWVDDKLLPNDVKQAVEDNLIYIHDKDFYGLTETCCQIRLDKLFEGGFHTGHGFIREPASITSAAALACIAIQSNQNEMHGGQSIPAFDWYMAKYVRMSYEKNVRKIEEAQVGKSTDEDRSMIGTIAWRWTEKETYQAMEALVHNLNTMHSRAGAQVPFSSLNYGTCTDKYGRLVTMCLLLATEKGLGHGETPIFPVQIFKVKEGVNFNEGDPNYDLFKLAIKVSSKRLFPNFSFMDAPFNAQYCVDGDPNTEVAYMGCADERETITVKDGDSVNVMGIGAAVKKYAEREDVSVWDSNAGRFVKVLTWIENPERGNWFHVKFSNGRSLTLTGDHPLPTQRGRVFVEDMVVGDKVPIADTPVIDGERKTSLYDPWLLGVLVCDSSYDGNMMVSLGLDEYDIATRIKAVCGERNVRFKEQHRGEKGNYLEVHIKRGSGLSKQILTDLFGGVRKMDRSLPCGFLAWNRRDRLELLAGIIDADGYINTGKGCTIQIGSTNKTLALQQLELLRSLGVPAKLYENFYGNGDKIRYRVEAQAPDDLMLTSAKKQVKMGAARSKPKNAKYAQVVSIAFIGERGKKSYDLETESDRFDLSGINSHNCRTRVMGNVNGDEVTGGRGNLSFTTVNLVRCALDADGEFNRFQLNVYDAMKIAEKQLLHRYKIQCARHVYNYPFLMGNGVWLDSDKLEWDDTLEGVLKHGTLSIGFIGLAEAMTAVFGRHHGEDVHVRQRAYETIASMRRECDNMTDKTGLNFSLLATPAEGLSGKFVGKDRERYGVIENVTDKEYYTNSFHVPVYYNISAADKIAIEAPFHAMCNAGHITYVELDGDMSANPEAFESVIRHMRLCDIGYGSVNHPVDRDPVCGYAGVIGDTCPVCGRSDMAASKHAYFAGLGEGVPFERIRRITGYLVGTMDRWNDAKRAEERDRVKHGMNV